MDDNQKNSRRNFLKKGLLSTVALSGVSTMASSLTEDNSTVKFLDQTGKLVEISKKDLAKITSSKKAADEELLNFVDHKKRKHGTV